MPLSFFFYSLCSGKFELLSKWFEKNSISTSHIWAFLDDDKIYGGASWVRGRERSFAFHICNDILNYSLLFNSPSLLPHIPCLFSFANFQNCSALLLFLPHSLPFHPSIPLNLCQLQNGLMEKYQNMQRTSMPPNAVCVCALVPLSLWGPVWVYNQRSEDILPGPHFRPPPPPPLMECLGVKTWFYG